MQFLQTKRMIEWSTTLRKEGVKGFARRYGKSILVWFILLYLIRDTLLYVIIPYLLAKGVLSSFPHVEKAFQR